MSARISRLFGVAVVQYFERTTGIGHDLIIRSKYSTTLKRHGQPRFGKHLGETPAYTRALVRRESRSSVNVSVALACLVVIVAGQEFRDKA
jgi:hypothetical protein